MTFVEELDQRIICADGAMGTLLMDRGAGADDCLEELCRTNPELIVGIHQEYLAAGAMVIRTNSFRANALHLEKFGLTSHVNEINWQAAQLARGAAKGTGAKVAGSVGPLGISAAEAKEKGIDREEIFRVQIGALLDGGAQMIWLETFQDVEELLLAAYVKQSLHHCPVIGSMSPSVDGCLPDGNTLGTAFHKLVKNDVDILGLNCLEGSTAFHFLPEAPSDIPLAVALHAGLPRHDKGKPVYDVTPAQFAAAALHLRERGARLLGGCCGTTPAHITALAGELRELQKPASES